MAKGHRGRNVIIRGAATAAFLLLAAGCAGITGSRIDAIPPVITPVVPDAAFAGRPIPVSATITDNSRIFQAALHYRGGADDRFITALPPVMDRGVCTWTLPAQGETGTLALYFIASDGRNITRNPAKGEHLVRVLLAPEDGLDLIREVLDYPLYEVTYLENRYPNIAGKDIRADFFLTSKDLKPIQAIINLAKDDASLRLLEQDESFCRGENVSYLLLDNSQTKQAVRDKTRAFFESLR